MIHRIPFITPYTRHMNSRHTYLGALGALLLLLLAPLSPATATAQQQRIVEEGGMGHYPAVMTEAASLPAHTLFQPQDLSPFGGTRLLPVVVWGNGACRNSPWEHYLFLNEIASHGYLVIATGYYPKEGEHYEGEMSTTQQQLESIDWAFSQNSDPQSPYYHRIDTAAICAAGMSCGGLQTLYNCADPRLKVLMICNSGLFVDPSIAMPNMPMPHKEKLAEIHTPVLYILGGEEDIAYGNGMDDFGRIQHVPAIAVNYPVGHGGTYAQPHGGEFALPAIAWLDWQLKGDMKAAAMFLGPKPELLERPRWTMEKNHQVDQLANGPELEFAFEIRATCGPAYEVGRTPRGRRVIIPITGGTVDGPTLHGTIVPGGADHQLVDDEHQRASLEAIYSLRTDDGFYIHVRNCGISVWGQSSGYFRTTPTFEAEYISPYSWLNDATFVCEPEGKDGYISLKVYRVK